MNLMGKIFTFLIFLMSTIFLVVSIMVGASDRKWKDQAQQEKNRATTALNNIDALKGESAKLKKTLELEKVSRAQQLGNLQSINLKSKKELEATKVRFADLQQTSQETARVLKAAEDRLIDQNNELTGLKENNKIQIDRITAQFDENRNIEKRLFEQTAQLEQLQQKEADLAAELALVNKVLTKNGLTKTSLTDSIAPKIEAVVTAVGQRGDKFAIMAGLDDGLRKGHEMDIYRSTRYVGVGIIIAAENNRSVLSIVKGTMNDSVREGDNVTTKL